MDLGEIQRAIESLPADAEQELLGWLKQRAGVRRQEDRARKRTEKEVRCPPTLRRAVIWSLFALGCFLAAEGAIFHSGLYSRYLEPDSSAGFLEGHMAWLRDAPPGPKPEILLIGDSRMAEGFSARTAVAASGNRYVFWNLGVPGATPRVWYYMLRDAIRSHPEPAAVVLGLDRFGEIDGGEKPQSRVSDVSYLTGRLRLTDCVDFADSMEARELWMEAMAGCLFRGIPLRKDVHELLTHWRSRIQRARDFLIHGHGYIDGYGGKFEELTGLSADFTKKQIYFPPGIKDWQRDTAQRTLLPPAPIVTGDQYRYRKLWMGRIVQLFAGRKTRVVFIEMPRAPLPIPDVPLPKKFLQETLQPPRVLQLPADTFHDLERPELFADGLHLNMAGRTIFSRRVGEETVHLLEASR